MRREKKLAAAVAAAIVLPCALVGSAVQAQTAFVAGDAYPVGANPALGQYSTSKSLGDAGLANLVTPNFVNGGYANGYIYGGTNANYSSGNNFVSSNFQTDSTGCNYPWLNRATGYSAAYGTGSSRVKWLGASGSNLNRFRARALTTVPDSSTYYMSMLLIESTVTSAATGLPSSILGGFGNAELPVAGNTQDTTAATGLYFGFANDGVSSYNGNSGNLVIRYNTGNKDSSNNWINSDAIVLNGSTGATTSIIHDQTYCVVAKVTVPTNGGLDTVNWWLNPTSGTSDAALQSSSGAFGTFTGNIVSGSSPGSSFSRLGFISQAWYQSAYFDEPRLSTTLAGLNFTTAANLIWNNAGGSGDGFTWDTLNANFNDGTGAIAYSNQLHDNVTFNDNNNFANNQYAYIIELQTSTGAAITQSPGSTTFNNSAAAYTVQGAGGIAGSGALTKLGSAAVYLNNTGANTYTGGTNVAGGTLYIGTATALPQGTNLTIGGGASVVANGLGAGTALVINSLSIVGQLDLQNTGLDVYGSNIGAVSAYLKAGLNGGKWNGTSGAIASSTAAADSTHLTALGSLVNDNGSGTPLYGTGGTIAAIFDGISPIDGDVLVKLTYYGDTNLDGKVDGSDYSRIDAAYLANKTTPGSVTGWYNGDFNYDGVINGSDYTLLDNAYNTQGAQISAAIASPTAQISGGNTSVPEPISLAWLGLGLAALGRKRRN